MGNRVAMLGRWVGLLIGVALAYELIVGFSSHVYCRE